MRNQLKYILNVSLLILIITSIVFKACVKEPAKLVVATIDSHNILLTEYKNRYKEFLQSTNFKDNLQFRLMFLQSLIDEYLLLKWADSTGMTNDVFHRQNMDEIEQQLLLNKLYEHQIKSKIKISDQELRQLYKWSKIRIHTRHLFARDAETSDMLYQRLQAGESWDSLAKEIFQDPILANNGGDIGFFKLGDMDPAFEKAAFQMNDGEISPPIITRKGFSIIQVIEREYDPFLIESDFQIRKNKFENIGLSYKKYPAVKSYTDSVQSELNIQFFKAGINQIWEEIDNIYSPSIENPIIGVDLLCVQFKGTSQPWTVGETIRKLKRLSDRQKRQIDSEENLKRVIIGLIIQKALLREAHRLRLNETDEFQKKSTIEKNTYIISEIIDKIYNNAHPQINDLQKYYSDNLTQFTTLPYYEVSEIVVKDSSLAVEIYNKIKSGIRFEDLAMQHSIRKESAEKGGYLGWGAPHQFGSIKTILTGSKKGDLLGPVAIEGIYIIIKVLNIEPPRQMSFEEALPDLESTIEPQTHRKAFIHFRDQIKERSHISIDNTLVREFILN